MYSPIRPGNHESNSDEPCKARSRPKRAARIQYESNSGATSTVARPKATILANRRMLLLLPTTHGHRLRHPGDRYHHSGFGPCDFRARLGRTRPPEPLIKLPVCVDRLLESVLRA